MRATLFACLLPLVARGGEDPQPATQRHADAGGRCSIALPSDWSVESSPDEDPDILLSVQCAPPDLDQPCFLAVRRGIAYYTPVAMLQRVRHSLARGSPPDSVTYRLEPAPHVVSAMPGPAGASLSVFACVEAGGVPWLVILICREKDWEALGAAFFGAAASVQAREGDDAQVPEGYRTREKGPLLYAWPESLSSRDLAKVTSLYDRAVREYEGYHGRIDTPKGDVRVVFVHEKRADATAVAPLPSGRTRDDWFCTDTGRAFACPVDPDDDVARANSLDTLGTLLHVQRYGGLEPRWMRYGENRVLQSWAETGRDLPSIACRYRDHIPSQPWPLRSLADDPDGVDDLWDQACGWVAFLHAGPRKYRRAYDDFRGEFAQTGDWRAAMDRHLFSLDQDEMQNDLRKFLAKDLKPVR